MKYYFKKMSVVLALVFMAISCSNDDNNDDNDDKGPRGIKYEVSGTYNSSITISYTDSNGKDATAIVNEIAAGPWTKKVQLNSNVSEVSLRIVGLGGTSDTQEVSMSIYNNGVLAIKKIAKPVNGNISLSSGSYVLPK